jgi:hypothetical protein
MPISLASLPANAACSGQFLAVADQDALVSLAATVLIGRVQLAVSVLHGAERKPSATTDTLKQKLRETLLLHSGDDPSHRDGLLFEIICWVAAELHAGPDEIVSEPHLKRRSRDWTRSR